MTSKFAIFCTAAEKDQEKYIARVLHWYDMLWPVFKNDTDFFCFSDGALSSPPSRERLRFISFFPALGRKSINVFPGYKRSFGEALRMLEDYEFVMLIENDVKILNFNRVLEFREKPGLYSSIDKKWSFIETGFMILNDREQRKKMKEHFLSEDGINEDTLFESTLSKYPFEYVFQSRRAEGAVIDTSKESLDYICQAMDNYKGYSKRILFTDSHALGDAAENLIAIKDFHNSNPSIEVNYQGTGEQLFENIPWVNRKMTRSTADQVVQITMDLINNSNKNGMQVVRCIEYDIEKKTGLKIHPGDLKLPVMFSNEELADRKMFAENGIPSAYWIINAGGKSDFTTKHYPVEYFQKIVDATKHKITWVQVGMSQHQHKPLQNVINMIDKTKSLRDFLKLIYFSSGVLTPISSTLHLSAMPMPANGKTRPCVVLGGGREPQSFTLYPNHHWFSAVGHLKCCSSPCWKAKVEKGENSCVNPVEIGGQLVPKCMTIINPHLVASKVLQLAHCF